MWNYSDTYERDPDSPTATTKILAAVNDNYKVVYLDQTTPAALVSWFYRNYVARNRFYARCDSESEMLDELLCALRGKNDQDMVSFELFDVVRASVRLA
ncbi:MAG: hypothetical protein ACYCOU_03000 [Sulfobacillus sp.]